MRGCKYEGTNKWQRARTSGRIHRKVLGFGTRQDFIYITDLAFTGCGSLSKLLHHSGTGPRGKKECHNFCSQYYHKDHTRQCVYTANRGSGTKQTYLCPFPFCFAPSLPAQAQRSRNSAQGENYEAEVPGLHLRPSGRQTFLANKRPNWPIVIPATAKPLHHRNPI